MGFWYVHTAPPPGFEQVRKSCLRAFGRFISPYFWAFGTSDKKMVKQSVLVNQIQAFGGPPGSFTPYPQVHATLPLGLDRLLPAFLRFFFLINSFCYAIHQCVFARFILLYINFFVQNKCDIECHTVVIHSDRP